MDHAGATLARRSDLFAQPGEIGGKN